MAKGIKGITIELDGNTKPLEKALSDVNKRSRDLQGELRSVDRLLKFNPDNVELLEQKQKLLNDQIENTSDRLNRLKNAQKQVEQQFKSGEIGEDQFRAFQREIIATEGRLDNFKKQAKNTFDQINSKQAVNKVNQVGDAFKRASKRARDFGKEAKDSFSGLGAASAGGAAALGGLVAGTSDYNKVLARLRTNASNTNADLSIVEQAFNNLVTVTGEADAAGETIANLLATGVKDTQLLDYVNQLNGAYIQFSDTLKTEGIADGIQESFAVGEATGPFLELLERSSVDIDTFNSKLQEAKSEGTGLDFILQTLSENGFAGIAEKYRELNPEIADNAEANQELMNSLSDLAILFTPLITSLTDFLTKVIDWTKENPKLAKTVAIVIGVITGLSAVFAILGPIIAGLTSPIGLVVAAIGALIAAGVFLWRNWDEIKAKAFEIWNSILTFFSELFNSIMSVFSNALDWIDEKTNGKFKSVTDAIRKYLEMGKKIVGNVIEFFKNTFKNGLDFLKSLVTLDFKGMKDAIGNQMSNIKNTIANIWNNVMDFFKGIDLLQIGKDIIRGLINGIKSMAKGVIDGVKGVVGGAIEGAKKLLGIASPSKVFKQFGVFVDQGFINGIESMTNKVAKAGQDMADSAIPTISSIPIEGIDTSSISTDLSAQQLQRKQQITIQPAPVYLNDQLVGEIIFDMMDQGFSSQISMNAYLKGEPV
ncbi:hypothetical protein [Ornithinibacillus xuwenensis]|uniref:Phage tail tape measure protein n=1 Tax=Ornithinibacillus xuwenensis TaxID=3144668 RepID=A0ABU9XBQ0_9BACI